MFTAFKHRNYRIFWSGNLISLIGSWMQTMALGWLVYRLTRSPFLLGLSSFFSSIPIVFISPLGGAVVDRMNKRKLLILTQSGMMLSAFILAGLTQFELIAIWHIFAIAIFGGFIAAFDAPARQSFVIELVGKEDLMNGIALNSLAFNSARILGPAIAGYAVAYVGESGCFFLNGLSFIAVIFALTMMTGLEQVNDTKEANLYDNLKEGFQYIKNQKLIWNLIVLVGISSLFSLSYAALLPIFAKEILGGDARTLGWLMSSVGVGAIIGALFVAKLGNFQHKGKLVLIAALGSAFCLMIFGASKWLWLSIGTLAIVGFCNVAYLATTNTLIQTTVNDELRGRVISLYTLIFLGGMPLGNLFVGAVAQKLGAPATVILGSAICFIYTASTSYRVPELRNA
ncbi:MAG: MFS transporter [bacterium]|nr:MFS transporter [bacterium]